MTWSWERRLEDCILNQKKPMQMKLKKGMILVFAEGKRQEKIVKASSDPIKGKVITEANEYSTDFINRWIHFGICRAFNEADLPQHLITEHG
jgi:hypothetical protein